MNVLVIANCIPTERYPLLGIFELDQAKALSSLGAKVTLFGVDLRSIRRPRKLGFSSGEIDGVKWFSYACPVGNVPRFLLRIIGAIIVKRMYKKVFKDGKPDIIHAHFTEMGAIAATLSKEVHVPLVITEHSSEMNKTEISQSLKKCADYGYSRASCLITVSSILAASIRKHLGYECTVIHNIVDIDTFGRCVRYPHEGFNIVTTGSLIPRKRIMNLLIAVHKLHSIYPKIKLHIIGDGYQRDELLQFVHSNNMEEYVTFWGRISREETTKVYQIADCFALVSERETFGVVYIEAMAAGLPVIATPCGGPEDFVNSSNGQLVEIDNEEQLIKAVERVYMKEVSYDTNEIKQYVIQNFSPRVIAKKLLDCYAKVLDNKKQH